MKVSKKGAILGALWGLVSAIGFGFQLTRQYINQITIYDILFLPGSLATRTVLAPAAGAFIVYPIFSILFGVLIGYVIGTVLEENKRKKLINFLLIK